VRSDELPGNTIGEVLDAARARYGEEFAAVLARSAVWVNGVSVDERQCLSSDDEVAIIPPVSGG